ncbi:MAG: acetate--CoA ligase family protein [Candidatus Moranbacteria bacterium]|nr:acetate--CoA ligase family protein [Candidatus Moranbacteria bacterium]MDD3964993.1 acetate--CoA ligase family protein [Candidatus Moranbacteria bacterium]
MQFETLFSPKSIAVIGASTQVGTVGYTLTENLLQNGYTGKVYPVNPKTDTLFNLPCYANISLIPYDIELAIIIVPAHIVPVVLREVAAKGIASAIIISAGFKETGEAGEKLEMEITTIARENNIALLGPNCLGFLRPSLGLNASFAKILPSDGHIAFFSQSGALCTALLDLTTTSLGFSHFVSIGNKAIIDENTLLQFFSADKNVSVISCYTEGVTDANKMIETGRAILARSDAKPIIALKSGTTTAGTQASSSHTGALAGSDAAYIALFKQSRIIRAESLENLIDLLTVFSHNTLPEDNRVAIITNAGGLGVLATDAAIESGLRIAPLSNVTKSRLRDVLPPSASVNNPVDVLGDALAERYEHALEVVVRDESVDMILVIVTPQTMTEDVKTAEALIAIKKHYNKPIVAVFAGQESFRAGSDLLKSHGVAVLTYPESGMRALGSLAQVTKWRKQLIVPEITLSNIDKEKARKILDDVQKNGRATPTEKETSEILSAYGFPFFATYEVQTREEAISAGQKIGKKVALKIVSPDIIHKSDAGGVILGIDSSDVGEAYDRLMVTVKKNVPDAHITGALVVEMAESGGKELLLGLKKEPGLGTLLVFGLGGIYVETLKDVTMRFVPTNETDIDEMIREIKSFAILSGVRGESGIDMSYLREVLMRLTQFAIDFPEVAELDINPLLSFPQKENFRVLDARIRLEKTL